MIVNFPSVGVEADVAYVLLLQEMSKISEHFCEKACAGPLMDSLLRSLLLFQDAMHSNVSIKVHVYMTVVI